MSSDRYTVISADTHGGASHEIYREYLEAKYLEQFDDWRAAYRNPFSDLGDDRRFRNWDDEMRNSQQDEDGVVGEVIFPNTVPPFFPGFVLFAKPPKPEEYELRLAGIRAHNRWMVDFCSRDPHRRAGIGQIFLNDVDDAIDDVRWIKEHGLRGGILLPNTPPDVDWVRQLNHPDYDRLWAVCEDLDVPINCHGGTGAPSYERTPSSALMMIAEVPFYGRRPLTFMILSGALERHPGLKLVITEQGCGWVPDHMAHLDMILTNVRERGAIGELRFSTDTILPRSATEYLHRNVWFGISFPSSHDLAATKDVIGLDRIMWGSDFPHDEGTYPYTTLALRQVFHGWNEADVRKVVAENAASVYGFDLEVLGARAASLGPLVGEIDQPLTELPAEPNEALLRNASAS